MDRIHQVQRSQNVATRDGWRCFTSHRQRVTQLLLDSAGAAEAKLCVLGAGNCNDLALAQLAEAFAQVDLVDIDEEALTAGMARQDIAVGRVVPHPRVDVTGVADLMSAWQPERPATNEQVDTCIASAERAELPLQADSYSVAASTCMLSQLVGSISLAMGVSHPRLFDLLTCLRREHVRQLIDLTVPGGTIVLITDVVSSLTLPEMTKSAAADLPTLVGNAIAQQNFFTGVNPFVIKRLFQTDVALAPRLTDVRLSDPWLWDLGPRLYAVCALTAKRLS